MRLALAAVLACGSADNTTTPRPNAAALLEAANKLRAEAAALETQAQAEAGALESATPAPTTPAPTPWSARPFRTRREDNRTTCSTTVDQCRAEYPELLRRIDWDLAPWRTKGITLNQTQLRYDEAVGNGDQLAISVRGGRAHVQRWGRGYKSRTVTAQNMITRSLEHVCGVPAVPKLCGTQISGAPRHRRDVVSVAASAREPNSLADFHTGIEVRLHDERPRAAPDRSTGGQGAAGDLVPPRGRSL